MRPSPSLSVAYTSLWMVCLRFFNSPRLRVSLWRTKVRFSQCLPPLRATVASVGLEMESSNINKRPPSGAEQKVRGAPLTWKYRKQISNMAVWTSHSSLITQENCWNSWDHSNCQSRWSNKILPEWWLPSQDHSSVRSFTYIKSDQEHFQVRSGCQISVFTVTVIMLDCCHRRVTRYLAVAKGRQASVTLPELLLQCLSQLAQQEAIV